MEEAISTIGDIVNQLPLVRASLAEAVVCAISEAIEGLTGFPSFWSDRFGTPVPPAPDGDADCYYRKVDGK